MRTWWQRNRPVVFTQGVMGPMLAAYYWPTWGWAVAVVVMTCAILFTVDAVVYRGLE